MSNGEKFRVGIARALLESQTSPICLDEFTSVVDRQVAKIASHAVQKFIRKKNDKRLVVSSCHADIIDWLQPDWIIEPTRPEITFARRSLRSRPRLNASIKRVTHAAWKFFAPFHYLTADLHRAAACFVLCIDDEPAAFAGILHRPNAVVDDIKGVSRLVTLPDYQGLGLAFVLVDCLGAAYKDLGLRLRTYPAHPALIRGFDRSRKWSLRKKPGLNSTSSRLSKTTTLTTANFSWGARQCAVFEYVGEAAENIEQSRQLIKRDDD